jgi:hypothetical protein
MSGPSSGRGWMLVVGVIVLAAGLIGAGALWYGSGQRLDDNVADFARAPSGCATTFDFARSGEFTVYVETMGSLDDLAGDCSADSEYDRDDVADPQLQLVDADGVGVDISDAAGVSYDTGVFAGSSVGVVQIATPGEYFVTVAAAGDQFAIAVGGDPNDGVGLLRWSAVALAIVSLVVGGILLMLGSRRPPGRASTDDPLWKPQGAATTWPIGPPGFPAPPPTTGATGPAGPPMAPPRNAPASVAPPGPAPSPWAPPSISNGA